MLLKIARCQEDSPYCKGIGNFAVEDFLIGCWGSEEE